MASTNSFVVVGPLWKDYESLQYLFTFGASYCDVGYHSGCPPPSKAEPLGVPFPGKTYAGNNKLNWVGYLAREFCPSGVGDVDPLLVFDYAKGGQTVSGVMSQVNDQFLDSAGRKPLWALWSQENSLFSTWIGINDCGIGYDPAESINNLFQVQKTLYERGARNFLFIDLPPMLRSPGSLRQERSTTSRQDPCKTWNAILRSDARGFVKEHSEASVFIFSAWDLFNEVLDDPVAHGFTRGDPIKARGGIWVDNLHPTTEIHRLIAQRLRDFLCNVKKARNEEEDVEVIFDGK